MRYFIGFLAALSSLFAQEPKIQPLNTAVITFSQTYYAPVATSPDILPSSYKNLKATIVDTDTDAGPKEKSAAQKPKPTPPPAPLPAPAPVITPPPTPPLAAAIIAPIVAPAPAPSTSSGQAGDPYLAKPEPIINWLKMDVSFTGDGFEGTRKFSPIAIDREYWKIDIWTYWINLNPTIKTPVEQDYFKIEVYEVGNNTPVFSAVSGKEESPHIYQSFKKAGKYYFKTYTKPVSKYEMNIYVSATLAK